jgi:hypothetical protein
MQKFKVEFDGEVLDFDADLMKIIPNMITTRFQGTAIRVSNVTITPKKEEEPS